MRPALERLAAIIEDAPERFVELVFEDKHTGARRSAGRFHVDELRDELGAALPADVEHTALVQFFKRLFE